MSEGSAPVQNAPPLVDRTTIGTVIYPTGKSHDPYIVTGTPVALALTVFDSTVISQMAAAFAAGSIIVMRTVAVINAIYTNIITCAAYNVTRSRNL